MDKLFKQIEVIFENDDLLVINKPSGIAVHRDGKNTEDTLAEWLLETRPDIASVGEAVVLNNTQVLRPGIVHRIDKDTSGLLLIAKSNEYLDFLKQQFKTRRIKKTYFAFVYGIPADVRGIIDRPIGRSAGNIRKWATGKEVRGITREARTRYKVIETGSGVSLLEVWPETGRTHQIRVHLASIGHPIIADPLYAPKRSGKLGFRRLALHARGLFVPLPKGKEKVFEAPFPADFVKARESLKIDLPK